MCAPDSRLLVWRHKRVGIACSAACAQVRTEVGLPVARECRLLVACATEGVRVNRVAIGAGRLAGATGGPAGIIMALVPERVMVGRAMEGERTLGVSRSFSFQRDPQRQTFARTKIDSGAAAWVATCSQR